VFGVAQPIGTSRFLATYLAALITGTSQHHARQDVEHFFEGMAWLAQIVLLLMLGLLVTPEDLPPYLPGAVIGTAVLILLARPLAVLVCLVPFGFSLRETAFASWVELRGGSDLPQHHPRIGRSATRRAAVCQHLHPGDRLADRARLDRGPSRPPAGLRAG
jgi:NhaP-type Na+/H+ and K+/H+ antiporter